jgi:hypothetical protein
VKTGKCWACGVEGPLDDDGNCEVLDGCLVRQREAVRVQLVDARRERDEALAVVRRVDALVAELTAHPVINALVALEAARWVPLTEAEAEGICESTCNQLEPEHVQAIDAAILDVRRRR